MKTKININKNFTKFFFRKLFFKILFSQNLLKLILIRKQNRSKKKRCPKIFNTNFVSQKYKMKILLENKNFKKGIFFLILLRTLYIFRDNIFFNTVGGEGEGVGGGGSACHSVGHDPHVFSVAYDLT